MSKLSYLARGTLDTLSDKLGLDLFLLYLCDSSNDACHTPRLARPGGKDGRCGVPMDSRRRPLGPLVMRADCVRTPPLQLEPRSPIRLVTGLRPPPRPITGPRLEYRVWMLYVWYVLTIV